MRSAALTRSAVAATRRAEAATAPFLELLLLLGGEDRLQFLERRLLCVVQLLLGGVGRERRLPDRQRVRVRRLERLLEGLVRATRALEERLQRLAALLLHLAPLRLLLLAQAEALGQLLRRRAEAGTSLIARPPAARPPRSLRARDTGRHGQRQGQH